MNEIISQVLNPDNCSAYTVADTFSDYSLNDVLKSNLCFGFAIEPISEEIFENDETVVSIKYGVFLNDLGELSDRNIPNRIFISPANKIKASDNRSPYLWSTMADDLILRYMDDSKLPVWVAMKKGDKTIWID